MLRTAVVGIFDNCQQSGKAISALREADFAPQSIFALCPCPGQSPEDAAPATAVDLEPETVRAYLADAGGWAVPPSVVAAAGDDPVVLAGEGISLAASRPFRSLDGVIAELLVSLAVPEFDAMVYEALVREGKSLVVATGCAREKRERARLIMETCQSLKLRGSMSPASARPIFHLGI